MDIELDQLDQRLFDQFNLKHCFVTLVPLDPLLIDNPVAKTRPRIICKFKRKTPLKSTRKRKSARLKWSAPVDHDVQIISDSGDRAVNGVDWDVTSQNQSSGDEISSKAALVNRINKKEQNKYIECFVIIKRLSEEYINDVLSKNQGIKHDQEKSLSSPTVQENTDIDTDFEEESCDNKLEPNLDENTESKQIQLNPRESTIKIKSIDSDSISESVDSLSEKKGPKKRKKNADLDNVNRDILSNINLSKLHSCGYCTFTTNKHKLMILHNSTHKAKECSLCSIKFNSISEWEKHFYGEHYGFTRFKQSILYGCKECAQCFESEATLESHFSSHVLTENNVFKCLICNTTFKRFESVINHMMKGHLKYKCTFCKFLASATSIVERHSHVTHLLEGRPFHCGLCEGRFYCFGALIAHKSDKHAIAWKDDKETCRLCSHSYHESDICQTLDHLSSHIENFALFRCISCNISSRSSTEIKEHGIMYHASLDLSHFIHEEEKNDLLKEIATITANTFKKKVKETKIKRLKPTVIETQAAIDNLCCKFPGVNEVPIFDSHSLESFDESSNINNIENPTTGLNSFSNKTTCQNDAIPVNNFQNNEKSVLEPFEAAFGINYSNDDTNFAQFTNNSMKINERDILGNVLASTLNETLLNVVVPVPVVPVVVENFSHINGYSTLASNQLEQLNGDPMFSSSESNFLINTTGHEFSASNGQASNSGDFQQNQFFYDSTRDQYFLNGAPVTIIQSDLTSYVPQEFYPVDPQSVFGTMPYTS